MTRFEKRVAAVVGRLVALEPGAATIVFASYAYAWRFFKEVRRQLRLVDTADGVVETWRWHRASTRVGTVEVAYAPSRIGLKGSKFKVIADSTTR